MFIWSWTTAGLLTALVVLCGETSEIEEQLDTCVWVGVEVNYDNGQNKSELPCEGPEKPSNGGYASDSDVDRYSTGDIIQYYCNRGYKLIGDNNRTCNGSSKQFEPDEPYCQPEYIGDLMRRLIGIEDKVSGVEDQMRVIEQRITTIENNTVHMGYKISAMDNRITTINNKVTSMDNIMSTMDNKVSVIDRKVSSTESNVSAIYNMGLFNWKIAYSGERLSVCTNVTKAIDEDTVSKCKTMQLGVRNGRSVSVYTWVIEDYKSKVSDQLLYSQPFYHTVPGYKVRLRGHMFTNSDIHISLQLLPGEYDDQLKWPFSKNYDAVILMNDGKEAQRRYYNRGQSNCHLDRVTSATWFQCFNEDPNWDAVWTNDKHILNDGSVVVKLYFYN